MLTGKGTLVLRRSRWSAKNRIDDGELHAYVYGLLRPQPVIEVEKYEASKWAWLSFKQVSPTYTHHNYTAGVRFAAKE